jgi:hypothetical protein
MRGRNFSSETMYSDCPFGVHQFWIYESPNMPDLKSMMESCPVTIGILPSSLFISERGWREMICSLNFSRDIIINTTSGGSYDFEELCEKLPKITDIR